MYSYDQGFLWGVVIACALVAAGLANSWDKKLHEKSPDVMPFKWGYFVAWMGIITGVVMAFLSFRNQALWYRKSDVDLVWGVICLGYAWIHYFMLQRHRLAWVVGVILHFNPVAWIINAIYIKNRWSEMGGKTTGATKKRENPLTKLFTRQSLPVRVIIAGTIFWAIVVLMFVLAFEPYGGYMSDGDWWKTIKIMLFPPIVAVSGYLLYTKVVRSGQKD